MAAARLSRSHLLGKQGGTNCLSKPAASRSVTRAGPVSRLHELCRGKSPRVGCDSQEGNRHSQDVGDVLICGSAVRHADGAIGMTVSPNGVRSAPIETRRRVILRAVTTIEGTLATIDGRSSSIGARSAAHAARSWLHGTYPRQFATRRPIASPCAADAMMSDHSRPIARRVSVSAR
jgi:hypothetical protein